MTYNGKKETENAVHFQNGNNHLIVPKSALILVDDGSGIQSIKAIGTRKTIALFKEPER